MKSIKGFLIVLAMLFIFITLFSLLIPGNVRITRAVMINAEKARVYNEISDLQNWKHWQPVFKADSAEITYTKGAGGLVDKAEWLTGGKKNTLTITDRKDNAVMALLKRDGENDTHYTIGILPVDQPGQIQVEWNIAIKLKWYPWEKFYGIFIEKVSGQGYEDALKSLKDYTENH